MRTLFQRNNIPNLITSIRLFSFVLFFVEPLSTPFLIIFGIMGLSDALDGFLARRLQVTSAKGAKLDSVADLIFYATMFARVMPYLWVNLPKKIWYVVGVILAIRCISYLYTYFTTKELASTHAILNKATGFMIYCLPYMTKLKYVSEKPLFVWYSYLVCLVAGIASTCELIFHIMDGRRLKKDEK